MIPIAKPTIGRAEAEAAARVVRSGWLTQGSEVAAFEREFAELTGAPHACAVSNCTTALHLALRAAGVVEGDEVVTVSHSFIATANAIRYCGAIPVFVDVTADTFNLDPTRLDGVLTPRTRAILCVHQLGMPCDMAAIIARARARGLPVIEDAACAIGSEILWNGRWERIGRPHGDAACFSFHPRKVVTTGDGGMITTRNTAWDAQFRLWRQHGMSVPDTVRHGSPRVIFEDYPVLGYNYRLTDVQAAIGREQLKQLPEIVRRRREVADGYARELASIDGLQTPSEPEWARTNWQSYAVRLPAEADQRTVMQQMLDAGIATRRGVMCAHRQPAYPPGTWTCDPTAPHGCRCVTRGCERLRVSEACEDRVVLLPLYAEMTLHTQQRVARALAHACATARAY